MARRRPVWPAERPPGRLTPDLNDDFTFGVYNQQADADDTPEAPRRRAGRRPRSSGRAHCSDPDADAALQPGRAAAIGTVAPAFMAVMRERGECDMSEAAEAVKNLVGGNVQVDTNRRRVYDCAAAFIGAGVMERVRAGRAWHRVRLTAIPSGDDAMIAERIAALRNAVRLRALARRDGGSMQMRVLVVGGQQATVHAARSGQVIRIRGDPGRLDSTPEVASRASFSTEELIHAFDELLAESPFPAEMEALRAEVCE